MANFFINGLNSKIGGGKTILDSYLTFINESDNKEGHQYIVLTPNKKEYLKYNNDFLKIIDIPSFMKIGMILPITYCLYLPLKLSKLKIDSIFNLAILPISTNIKQVYLCHNSYLTYPESIIWNILDLSFKFKMKVRIFFFKKTIKYIDTFIVQTEVMKKRLEAIYNLKNIKIIPNAVSLYNLKDRAKHYNYNFSNKDIKLLYLTHYSPHKNLEIFIPLAKKIKEEKKNYKIIITLNKKNSKKAIVFLETIKKENLENVIINIGFVDYRYVGSLYQQCDALLMPTLLESFGLPYIEAMYNEKTILTSNLDFAEVVCESVAYYFDPMVSTSIFEKIEEAFSNEQIRKDKIAKGLKRLKTLKTWNEVFNDYMNLIKEGLNKN